MHARSSVVLFGLVIAFVAAGCGGGGAKKASPEKYVSTVCSSADAWSTGVDSYVKKLDGLYAQLTRTSDLPKLKTKRAVFLLQKKKGSKWVKVRSTTKSGSIKACTTTVKKLCGSKAVSVGQYRVKISADANSVSRFFRIKRKAGVGDPDTSTAPNAGLWSNEKIGSDNGVRFYVEPTRKNVLRFDHWYHYSGETAACTGDSAVGTPATGALSMIPVHPDGSFFYSALTSTTGSSFTISGIFDSPTSAHGTAKVIWVSASCYFDSTDVPWTASWKSVAQPS